MDSNNGGYSSRRASSTAAEIARQKVLAVYNSAVENIKKTNSTPTPTSDSSTKNNPYPENYDDSSTQFSNGSRTAIYSSPQPDEVAGFYDSAETSPTEFIYDQNQDLNQPAKNQDYSNPVAVTTLSDPNLATASDTLKDLPVNQSSIDDEWRKYHSAWQNYYQNYYNEYYSKAAQNYLATEKLKTERIASGKARRERRIKHLIPIIVVALVIIAVLFLQYNRIIFAPIMAYVSPDDGSVATNIEAIDPSTTQAVSAEPRLIIPKLNIDVPVAFGIDYNDVMEAMNHGVAQFMIPGANAMPGQVGNLVISGHSAGDIYSSNPYKFIFSGLERLSAGDLIYINYESVRYTYRMTGNQTVEPSDVSALIYPTDKPILTLITCTPLGTSRYRLLVTAEQINPVPEASSGELTSPTSDPSADYSMPANDPSFLESIWNGIFGE